MFFVEFSSQSKRFLKRLDKTTAKRIIEKIKALAVDPFPYEVKRIVNRKEKVFRIKVGSYRILYLVVYEKNLIFISDIDKRGRVYK